MMAVSLPIMLLPGTLCDARVFAPSMRLLSERIIRVAPLPPLDTVRGMARAVLAEAPPRFAFAGLSLGGIVGLEIAAIAPERLAGVALIGSNARAVPETFWRRRRVEAAAAALDLERYAREVLVPLYAGSRVTDHAAFAEVVIEMAKAAGGEALLRQTEAALTRTDGRAKLSGIRVPTVVIGGTADRLGTAEMQREMAAAIPEAVLALLPGVGHLATLEDPAAVARAMADWLERVDRSESAAERHKELT